MGKRNGIVGDGRKVVAYAVRRDLVLVHPGCLHEAQKPIMHGDGLNPWRYAMIETIHYKAARGMMPCVICGMAIKSGGAS